MKSEKKQTKRMTKKKPAKYSVKMTASLSPMAVGAVAKPKRGKRAAATHATDVTSFAFQLGATVNDSVTGIEGMITGRAQYLTGCSQYCVQPRSVDGGVTVPDGRWFDENRLVQLADRGVLQLPRGITGGPQANEPPRA